MEKENYRSWST